MMARKAGTVLDMAAVSAHWNELSRREQRLLAMRCYGNMAQAEIGGHVSRLLARALGHLRERLLGSRPGAVASAS